MFFIRLLTVIRRYAYGKAFEIGKYPVTNIEYSRFIEATNYHAPIQWVEDKYPLKEASYPVTGITPLDARAYCKWLSQQTGKKYRLPTEWEWEWAAAGPDGYQYPWGEQFDKDKCNTEEADINGVNPVGSYRNAMSWIKASDMCGNVWEITDGFLNLILAVINASEGIGAILLGAILGVILGALGVGLLGVLLAMGLLSASLVGLIALGEGVWEEYSSNPLRGGAWNSHAKQATSFYRGAYLDKHSKFCGFRCARDIPPIV